MNVPLPTKPDLFGPRHPAHPSPDALGMLSWLSGEKLPRQSRSRKGRRPALRLAASLPRLALPARPQRMFLRVAAGLLGIGLLGTLAWHLSAPPSSMTAVAGAATSLPASERPASALGASIATPSAVATRPAMAATSTAHAATRPSPGKAASSAEHPPLTPAPRAGDTAGKPETPVDLDVEVLDWMLRTTPPSPDSSR